MAGWLRGLLDGVTIASAAVIAVSMTTIVWRSSTRAKGCFFVFALAILVLLPGLIGFIDAPEAETMSSRVLALALTAAWVQLYMTALGLAMALIIMAIVPALRPIGLILFQRLMRWREASDFAAARAAAGREGTVLRSPGLTVWTDIDPSRHAGFSKTLDRMVEATEGATGLPLDRRKALRVIAFDDGRGSRAYGGRLGRLFERAGGYYIRFPRPVVLVHRETVELIRPNLDWVLAHEYAHYLTFSAMGPIREVWLSEGLAMYLPSLALETHPRSIRPTRILQAAIQRGDMPAPRTFLRANALRLFGLDAKSAKGHRRAEAAGQVTLYYFMSGAFVRYLHRRDAAAFQRFLRGYRRAGASSRHFRACYGVSPERALQDHVDHVLASEKPPIRLPLPEEAATIEREILAPLDDPDTPLEKRLELLWTYGLNAAAWRIERVIDQLEADEGSLIHAAAQRALENVAGGRVAEGAAAWRAWARALPPELVGPGST